MAEQRWSKTQILDLLQNASSLPSKSDLEDQFTQDLLLDRDIVLAFCQRDDFATLQQERTFVLPKEFFGDKIVMMAFCRKVPNALQLCSIELQSDPEVVRAAIQTDGMALQFASQDLREDADWIRLACKSDGRALSLCPPGPTHQALLNDQEFMMRTLSRSSPKAVNVIWKMAPEYLKHDVEFLVTALQAGLAPEEIPDTMVTPELLQDHPELCEQLIPFKPHIYLELDEDTIRQREDLALQAITSPNSNTKIHAKALAHFPNLASQRREVALIIAQRGDLNLLGHHWDNDQIMAEPVWLDDTKVMIAILRRDGHWISRASQRMPQAVDLVRNGITAANVVVILQGLQTSVRFEVLRRHPDITGKAIELCENLDFIKGLIPDSTRIWSQKEVYIPWLKKGGTAINICVGPHKSNKEIALAIAKYNWKEFWRVDVELRNDREFVLQAIQENGMVIVDVAPSLQCDLEIVGLALVQIGRCSTKSEEFRRLRHSFHLKDLRQRLQSLLDADCEQNPTGNARKEPHDVYVEAYDILNFFAEESSSLHVKDHATAE